jgi:hypothetical protein
VHGERSGLILLEIYAIFAKHSLCYRFKSRILEGNFIIGIITGFTMTGRYSNHNTISFASSGLRYYTDSIFLPRAWAAALMARKESLAKKSYRA